MKSWYEGLIFKNQSFAFEFLRVLSKAVEHGADIGECLATAVRIGEKERDFKTGLQSWYDEWRATAERVHKIGDESFARGHKESACDAYLRASEYYRSADFYLHDNPKNPAILDLWDKMYSCFNKARELSVPTFDAITIPYEGTTLPGYFCPAYSDRRPAPTLIIHSGFDGTTEEIYFECGRDAVRRGYNCLAFEGPGQGSVIRKQGLPFRPDWEKVVTPVVDYAMKRPEVNSRQVALMGISMGGYMAPRAAAFEHRLAACIANEGIFDLFERNYSDFGLSRDEIKNFILQKREEFETTLRETMSKNIHVYWRITHGMWTFDAKTPAEFALKQENYTLKDCVHQISCPTLVIDSEAEQSFKGQAKRLFAALSCPKTFLEFKAGEGSELHCQIGGRLLGNQQIFDWLDETLAKAEKM